MKLYRLEVPITNYMGDGIFFQDMFILSENSPFSVDWTQLAKDYHQRDSQYPEYTGDWKEVVNTLLKADIPRLTGNLVQANIFVDTKFGKQPLTIRQQIYKQL